VTAPVAALAVLRAEIDAVLADWAWHLDHREYDDLVELFTDDALFISGTAELRGRAAIKNRYTERTVVRATRHLYSGLRVAAIGGAPDHGAADHGAADHGAADLDARPARVRARSTWVNYAANAPAPVDDVGVYLVADFDDVLTWCADSRWRISERRIVPVFRDPTRAPVTS
jgi:ketosteroid isomerase-like protein